MKAPQRLMKRRAAAVLLVLCLAGMAAAQQPKPAAKSDVLPADELHIFACTKLGRSS